MAETPRRQSAERRNRIVEAARYLILKHGFRATTMEAIAREAKIAKPTLYGYFADKDTVFEAILDGLLDEIASRFDAALNGSGDVANRIAAALAAKYQTIADTLEGSPHADELYSDQSRHVHARLQHVEAEIEAAIVNALKVAGITEPDSLGKLVLAGTGGIGKQYPLKDTAPAIRLMVERLLRPAMP